MTKLVFIFMTFTLWFSLAACSSNEPNATPTEDNTLEVTEMEIPENFVLIKGGTFQMGSPESEAWRSADETQHSVTVSDFYIS